MINLNGTLYSENKPLFNAGNRAFLYGDQVFETIQFQNGKLLFWEDHYFRMMGAACMLRMEIPTHLNMEYIKNEIEKTIESCDLAVNSARVRLSIFRTRGGKYKPLDRTLEYLIEVEALHLDKFELEEQGLRIDVFHDHLKPQEALSSLKGANSLVSVLSAIYADENTLDEAIILNSSSEMCETTNSNIFVVKKGIIYTPPLSSGCVDGIIRKKIIENAEDWSIQVEEITMKPFELIKADEVFLTNTVSGIKWVESYKKKQYTNTFTRELLMKLNKACGLV